MAIRGVAPIGFAGQPRRHAGRSPRPRPREGHGPGFPIKGDNIIEDVRYQPPGTENPKSEIRNPKSAGRVWINDRQYFEPVPPEAWSFPIGGYQPAERWLKDRRGRALGYDDLTGYARLIHALDETRRLMGEIDALLAAHGGWPLR